MWTCPECERRFGKKNQNHECSPGLSVAEYFESGPEFERPIFEAILAHLQSLDPEVYFEPVQVGIFFKRRTRFLALRTMTKWVAVGFQLDHNLTNKRIARKVIENSGRYYHVVNVRSTAEVDDQLRNWLADSWASDE
jgi:hypothetical protein